MTTLRPLNLPAISYRNTSPVFGNTLNQSVHFAGIRNWVPFLTRKTATMTLEEQVEAIRVQLASEDPQVREQGVNATAGLGEENLDLQITLCAPMRYDPSENVQNAVARRFGFIAGMGSVDDQYQAGLSTENRGIIAGVQSYIEEHTWRPK